MHETDILGMEEKAGGRCAVEVIAYDGAMQSVGMGGMYAQLVGAAGKWIEGDAGCIFRRLQYLIASDGLLALFVINHLMRTIEPV